MGHFQWTLLSSPLLSIWGREVGCFIVHNDQILLSWEFVGL
jgi:hypothetical protein